MCADWTTFERRLISALTRSTTVSGGVPSPLMYDLEARIKWMDSRNVRTHVLSLSGGMPWQWASLDAADKRGIPVFGICRGLQFLNVHRGGSLLQHVEGQVGAAYPETPALSHPLDVAAGTRLASILGDAAAPLAVNSYHHQAVTEERLSPRLVAAAFADSPRGRLVEGLEQPGDRFVIGVQCHPERTESSPAELERVWHAFVDAARR